MKLDLIQWLACPNCQSDLKLIGAQTDKDITEGNLTCLKCSKSYPIVRGIPRFVESENYVESFGYEWRELFEWRTENNIDPKDEEEIFRVKTGWTPDTIKGTLVLDAGCGSGRYAYVAASWGATVIAVDMSLAVEKTQKVCSGLNVHIIQADIFHLPLKNSIFSNAYSIGVLHHSTNTKQAFQSVASKIKSGGSLAVWLYRKNTWFQEWLNDWIRTRTVTMNREHLLVLSKFLAILSGIPVLNIILGRIINLGATYPNFGKRVCDAFDWYSPTYQWHHTPQELSSWLQESGFQSIKELPPQKSGPIYDWFYKNNLIIGSGVNFVGFNKNT